MTGFGDNQTFDIGGDLPVGRLGYGAMQITGSGIWGAPADPEACRAVLRRAIERGVTLIDTADSYGPGISEELIAESLHPYPDELVIATKAGFARTGPHEWRVLGFPEYLTQQCELSLRRLKLEAIDVFQLHRIDKRVPLADQLGALVALRDAGKIRHIGLSEITVSQLDAACEITEVATVQNLYNVGNRVCEPLLSVCEERGIGFFPWYPIQTGKLAAVDGPLGMLAGETGATPAQLALAWLLNRAPNVLPIPGTSSIEHLDENLDTRRLRFDDLDSAVLAGLDQLATPGTDPERIATSR